MVASNSLLLLLSESYLFKIEIQTIKINNFSKYQNRYTFFGTKHVRAIRLLPFYSVFIAVFMV